VRIFEFTIVILVLVSLVGRFVPSLRKDAIHHYLICAAGVAITLHMLIEGHRWQMVPLYILTAGLLVISIFEMKYRAQQDHLIRNKKLRVMVSIFVGFLFLSSIVLPLMLPAKNLPRPTGPYAVGTVNYRMIDTTRPEIFTEDPKDVRNLLVTAWYPAELEERIPVATYWDKNRITGRAYSVNAGMGKFWYSHLSVVKTNSHPGAPVATDLESYPVIIYSPSFYGLNTENTMLMEELASNGYVVFGITHTYETIASIFPDGEAVKGDLDYISTLFDSHADDERQLYQEYEESDDIEEKRELIRQIFVVDELSAQFIKIRKNDVIFVLNEIENLNNDEGLFSSKLNMSKVGVMGWSFGGATAADVCIADSRFNAGVNIDGWPTGTLFNSNQSLTQPFMFIRSGNDEEMETMVSDIIYDKMNNSGYVVSIEGARHMNFWDFPYFFPIYKYIDFWGPIDAQRLLEINTTYITWFFDQYLKYQHTNLPANQFPEVTLRVKN